MNRNGKGSKSGASMKCPGCQGSGMKVIIRQLSPSMVQQMQHPCSQCKGTGEVIDDKDRCPQCKGEKVVQEKKVLEVVMEKGMCNGQKITFPGEAFATSSTDARKYSGEYWQGIMQDQPMPETIQGLLHKDSVVVVPLSNKRSDCDHDKEQSTLVKDGVVEPQPSATVYRDDTKLTAFESKPSATEKAFVKDFDEQGPNVFN